MNIWKVRKYKPMLLKEIDKPFDSKDYIFEMKFDGIRALCYANRNKITLMSRNNIDMTYLYPELESIKNIVSKNVIFDGEIVAFKDDKPSFAKLQERAHLKDKNKIRNQASIDPVVFVVFDIIYEGKDITNLSLIERKEILDKYKDTDEFIKVKYINTNGKNLFKEIKKKNLEGIVAKLKTGTYHINKRTDDFIKIKNIQRDEFLIGGYELKKENISLYLAELKNNKLHYIGNCNLPASNPAYQKIIKCKESKNHFDDLDKNINFIKPIGCHIEYLEKNKNNHLRHAVFKGLA